MHAHVAATVRVSADSDKELYESSTFLIDAKDLTWYLKRNNIYGVQIFTKIHELS